MISGKELALVVSLINFCFGLCRFHELSEFDDSKRSCRRRLAGHNERRRKSSAEGNLDGRIQMSDSGATAVNSILDVLKLYPPTVD
ncbi:squamosa promoter-binding protein 1-like [Canna indica]|uniref:Squamosa promoter-binding protein 1-like n=1 Tax=Canna indica TaxID=4628 RepID=A0AAQ3K481_9LILI|nr:squamosa promoter-binding protein 1-like [Canna indica]